MSAATLCGIWLLAYNLSLIHWLPREENWPLRLVTVMAVPALTEELVFRGALIPSHGETKNSRLWMAGGLSAFVLWHVVEALTFLPGARLFLDPGFLVCTAMLGAACILMRYRTGSVWPGVLLHGLMVFAWQALFGGPGFANLMT